VLHHAEDSNSALVQRAQSGDPRSLERIMAESKPQLYRYARRHCESDDLEDAVQDALYILYRNIGSLRSVAALASWLFQVVRRLCLGYARKKKKYLPLDALSTSAEIDRGAEDPELRALLATIISKLPQVYREVLLLGDILGYSAVEMAQLLGISAEAAKSRLHRARAMVREEYTRHAANKVSGLSIVGASYGIRK